MNNPSSSRNQYTTNSVLYEPDDPPFFVKNPSQEFGHRAATVSAWLRSLAPRTEYATKRALWISC
jgi:hypothetical protein